MPLTRLLHENRKKKIIVHSGSYYMHDIIRYYKKKKIFKFEQKLTKSIPSLLSIK